MNDRAAPAPAAPLAEDLRALSWVQDEVRRSLEAAHKSLHRHLREADALRGSDVDRVDPTVLRHARTHFHQAAGALELVGMRVPAQMLRASERAVQRMGERPSTATAANVQAIEQASFALIDYLGRLTAGKTVSGMALFPPYASLQELAGADRIHPADLWDFDWTWRVIAHETDLPPVLADTQAREAMERLILRLMRTPDRTTLRRMSDLCAGLGADAKGRRSTMWRLAAGFFEAQAAGLLRYDVYVKRAAPRLLAQARLGLRSGDVSDRLANDLLFFCARASAPATEAEAPRLFAVRRAYGLDRVVLGDYESSTLGRYDPSVLMQARKRVAAAREAWSAVAGGEAHRPQTLGDTLALVQDTLEKLYPEGAELGRALVHAGMVASGPAGVPAPLAMEVATAVLYLEASLEDAELDDPRLGPRIRHLAQRIDKVRMGAEPQPLEPWMEELYRRVSDNQTIGSVVQELRGALVEIEKHIDQYFRQPQQPELLFPVPGQLSVMRGVVSVLGLDAATHAVMRMREDVDVLAHGATDMRQEEIFERLADNLGALSFLIDILAVQPNLAKALFRFEPETGRLLALMSSAPRDVPAVDDLPDTGPGDLGERAHRIARDAARSEISDEVLVRELRSLAQQALLAEQRRLADTLTAAQSAIERAADPEVKRSLRAELVTRMQNWSGAAVPQRAVPAPAAAAPALAAAAHASAPATVPTSAPMALPVPAPVAQPDLPAAEPVAVDRSEPMEQTAALDGGLPQAPVLPSIEPIPAVESTQVFAGTPLIVPLAPSASPAMPADEIDIVLDDIGFEPSAVPDAPASAPESAAEQAVDAALEPMAPARVEPAIEPIAAMPALAPMPATVPPPAVPAASVPLVALSEDDAEMLEVFLEEAGEVIQTARESLHSLAAPERDTSGDLSDLTGIRRAFHTLKGSSRMVGLSDFGEAAWACEQLYNARLAHSPHLDAPLRGLTEQALDYLEAWTLAIRARRDDGHRKQPVIEAADALRLQARVLPIQAPCAPEPAGVSPPHVVDEAAMPVAHETAPEAAEAAPAIAPEAIHAATAVPHEVADDTLNPVDALETAEEIEADPLQAPSFEAARLDLAQMDLPDLELGTVDEPAELLQDTVEAQAAATPDAAAGSDEAIEAIAAPEAAEAAEATEAAGAVELVELASWDTVPRDDVQAATDALAPVAAVDGAVHTAHAPATGIEWQPPPALDVSEAVSAEAAHAVPTPVPAADFDGTSPRFEPIVEPVVEPLHTPDSQLQAWPVFGEPAEGSLAASAALPWNDTGAGVDPSIIPSALEEPVKVVGPLRIEIGMFNIYLNEADELSRRLGTLLAEWAVQPEGPPGESAVVMAHSLAGSSATVGYTGLSVLARALEHALMRSNDAGVVTPGEPELYNAVADEIRRVLHQFAAGFLSEPAADLIERLEQHQPQAPAESVAVPSLQPVSAGPSGADRRIAHDDDIDAQDSVDPELFPIFADEAQDLLPELQARMQLWLQQPGERGAAAACMRSLHTFKGGARLAGAMRIGEMTHRLETAVERLMAGDATLAADIEPLVWRVDAIDAAFAQLHEAFEAAQADTAALPLLPAEISASRPMALASPPPAEGSQPAGTDAVSGIDWARLAARDHRAMLGDDVHAAHVVHGGAVRVRATLLDRLVNHAGEVSIARTRLESDLGQIKTNLVDLTENLDRLRRQLRDVEVQAESQISSRMEAAKAAAVEFDPLEMDRYTRVQELTRMMAESVNDVATVQRGLQRTLQSAEDQIAQQGRLTRSLQDDLLRTRMVEFESLSDRLYRVVRQAAKETGKQVRLDIVGGSIEIDRSVLDRMTAPFEHLLRNAITHGIEKPEVRAAAGKPTVGTIEIRLQPDGNEVAVEFIDDGAGLNLGRIRERALASGMVASGQDVSDEQLTGFIFAPGFTTAETVTELAGRGVGMDVVRSEIKAIGGRVQVRSEAGAGAAFRLVLPLTTAVTQVVMLRCGDIKVAVPANLVEIVRREPAHDVEHAYRQGEWTHAGETIPFHWLGGLLSGDAAGAVAGRTAALVIVRSAAQRVALHVDEVLGNQEVVVKNLGPQLSRLPGLTGMTLLPSGVVAAIYNPVALAAWYGEATRARVLALLSAQKSTDTAAEESPVVPLATLVLVVDDSLTVRRVTQRLLQREGYRVVTAKDGLDALERIGEERPQVILSDIEMPRMDGFDFVRNLRADPDLAGLPVIMITSRIAQKHRDYALELGVQHYLGKPYGEEELLGIVARLARRESADAEA